MESHVRPDRREEVTAVLIRILLILIVGLAVSACGSPTRDGSQQDSESVTPTGAYPAAFTASLLSWQEAADSLGYPLLRNESVPLRFPELAVSPSIEIEGSIPRKAEALYIWNVTGVKVEMAPEAYFGSENVRIGELLEIGGRQGWLSRRRQVMIYTFPYETSVEFGTVWCQVELDADDTSVMAEFVSGLR